MINWVKKGLIYEPPFDGSWRDNSALTPTAFLLNEEVIRIYSSFRNKSGIGRIGYVDVMANDPSCILNISDKPVLDIGKTGMFDDSGVILGDVIRVDKSLYMYYVGFQKVKGVKFLAYTGLAVSDDKGETFNRVSETPILEREDEGLFIRAIHSVIFEDNKFKVWYSTGNGWEKIGNIDYPQYDINYIESSDGINFAKSGVKCIKNDINNFEYRIGRPRVYKKLDLYIMNFTYGTTDGRYMAGQATSVDGVNWVRADEKIGIELSKAGWDSRHLSYPSIVVTKNKTYMFYNGNEMGFKGFGYAEL